MSQESEPATKHDLNRLETKVNDVEKRLTAEIDANRQMIATNATKIEENGRKIDANAAKIDANAAKIDGVEKRLTAKIDANATKIEANNAALARVSKQVIENRDLIGKTLTREEHKRDFHEIMRSLDALMSAFTRLDQEKAATNARLDRVETDVGKNKRDIKEIKTKLAMP